MKLKPLPRILPFGLPLLLLDTAACSLGAPGIQSDDDSADAGVADVCPADRIHARFSISGTPLDGEIQGTYLDRSPPEMFAQEATAGGCTLMVKRPGQCATDCPDGEICDVHATCQPLPHPMPAGKLTLRGTMPQLIIQPNRNQQNQYRSAGHPGLYWTDDIITLELQGEDAAPRLTMSTTGVPPLDLTTTAVTAERGVPMTLTWRPPAAANDAPVILHLQTGRHAAFDTYLECTAPASAGTLAVPVEILDRLIDAGDTGERPGIGEGWIAIRRRVLTPTPDGCGQFDAENRYQLEVINR